MSCTCIVWKQYNSRIYNYIHSFLSKCFTRDLTLSLSLNVSQSITSFQYFTSLNSVALTFIFFNLSISLPLAGILALGRRSHKINYFITSDITILLSVILLIWRTPMLFNGLIYSFLWEKGFPSNAHKLG